MPAPAWAPRATSSISIAVARAGRRSSPIAKKSATWEWPIMLTRAAWTAMHSAA